MFRVTFLYSGGLWFLFIVEVATCGWSWNSGLSKFLIMEACISVLAGGAGVSSFWSAMKCPIVSFEVSVSLVWFWADCILMLRAVFLYCWRISMVCLALKFVGSWVELGFSVCIEALE